MTPTPRDRAQAWSILIRIFPRADADSLRLREPEMEVIATALAAREAEVREACAKIVEDLPTANPLMWDPLVTDNIAAAIRASVAP